MGEIRQSAAAAPAPLCAAVTPADVEDSWFAGAAAAAFDRDDPAASPATAIGSATLARDTRAPARDAAPRRRGVARPARAAGSVSRRTGRARVAGLGTLLLASVVVLALTIDPPHTLPHMAAQPRARHHLPGVVRTPPARPEPAAGRGENAGQLRAPITAPPQRSQRPRPARRPRPATAATPPTGRKPTAAAAPAAARAPAAPPVSVPSAPAPGARRAAATPAAT